MTAVFGEVHFEGWQFRDLMPAWGADTVAWPQGVLALSTRRGQIHDGLHPLDGDQRPRVSRMAWLPTWFAATLLPDP
jgi:hypothetical protein